MVSHAWPIQSILKSRLTILFSSKTDDSLYRIGWYSYSALSSNFNNHFSIITQIGLEHGTHLAAERSKCLTEDKNVNAISWDTLEYCL